MGLKKFYKMVKIHVRCLFETVHALAEINIDKPVFVYQIHDVILIDDVLGEISQRDFMYSKRDIRLFRK